MEDKRDPYHCPCGKPKVSTDVACEACYPRDPMVELCGYEEGHLYAGTTKICPLPVDHEGKCHPTAIPRKGYHLVPCPGSAHSNPHVDNCGQCAPRWGWIEVPDDWQAAPCTCDPICMDENSLPSHCHCGCERCPNQPTDTVRR